MDMTDVASASTKCKHKKKERHSNGATATWRNGFATKNPNKSPKTTQKTSNQKNSTQKGTDTTAMKRSNKLKALWKGCFVRRSSSSIHHTTNNKENDHQHNKNGKADHGMVAVAASSNSKSAIIRPPLTICINKTGPCTLHTVSSSSFASSSSTPLFLRLKDFALFAPPPLRQQGNRCNFAEFIFSIPHQVLNVYASAKLSLDECESNLLHLACFQRTTTHDAIRYIFDNCSYKNQHYLLTNTDREGNLPSHILVSSICCEKIDLDDGLKILKLFYEICPETIFELNSNEELVTDIAYGFQRYIHEDSSEFLRLDTLYSCLRDMMSQIWLKRQLQWEEIGHEQNDFDAIRSLISSAVGEVSTTSAIKSESFVDNLC